MHAMIIYTIKVLALFSSITLYLADVEALAQTCYY